MAKDMGDALGTALGKMAREAAQNVASDGRKRGPLPSLRKGSSPLSGMKGVKGVAAGAGAAALAPLAAKGAGKLAKRAIGNGGDPLKKAGAKATEGAKEAVDKSGGVGGIARDAVQKSGGAPGIAKEAAKGMLPSGGGGGKGGQPGVGKGRRMPVQQWVDVAVPLETVYKRWTQYEEWPEFMHRVTNVTQDEEDENIVSFKTKIWAVSKEFKAEILEDVPNKRIKWEVNEGLVHKGVVTFHELAPELTRIELSFDVEPGSLIEKAARGMRHVKRAARADLHRFKAYVEWEPEKDDGETKKPQRSRERKSSSSDAPKRSSSSRSKASSSGSGNRSASSRKRGSSSRGSSNNGSSASGSGRKRSSSRS